MKRTLPAIVVVAAAVGTAAAERHDGSFDEARAVAAEFTIALKSELQAAMRSGGALAAVAVCNERAPEITERIGRERGWQVGRTSLKLRNPTNRPDAWEREQLQRFEDRMAAGEPPAELEASAIEVVDGRSRLRYMKAIVTQPLCLQCHGADIDRKLAQRLDALYPTDQARGYREGELRGAFTLQVVR